MINGFYWISLDLLEARVVAQLANACIHTTEEEFQVNQMNSDESSDEYKKYCTLWKFEISDKYCLLETQDNLVFSMKLKQKKKVWSLWRGSQYHLSVRELKLAKFLACLNFTCFACSKLGVNTNAQCTHFVW